jgi:hypothetical protein
VSGGELAFMLSLVLPGALGFLIGRWWFLLAIVGIWLGIALHLRENNGWHGQGWGDTGRLLTLSWALLSLLSGAIGVAVRRTSARIARLRS